MPHSLRQITGNRQRFPSIDGVDNLLDYMDETFFLDFTAQQHGPPLIQFTWIYEHEVDLAALERFQANLGKGLLGRRVERSPLPFGRPRWVSWSPPASLDVAGRPRSREDLTAWADEIAALPIDFEHGPPWRLSVQPLSEGGSAVTLVVAHGVADGMGMNLAVANAVNGTCQDLGYPPAKSRSIVKSVLQDALETLRDIPQVLKAIVLAPLAAKDIPRLTRMRNVPKSALVHRRGGGDLALPDKRIVKLPSVTALVDTQHWDERAESLHGTSNPLLIAVAARLCKAFGWLDDEGLACFMIPVNERTPGDTRGNALTAVQLIADPSTVSSDLRGIRADVRSALAGLREARNRLLTPLPLTPFVPRFLARRLEGTVMKSANLTVSHFGDLDPAVNRPDGTDAEWFWARHARWADGIDSDFLRRAGGVFFPIASGRLGGKIYISVCYSDAEGSMTTERLRAAVRATLDEFGVKGEIR